MGSVTTVAQSLGVAYAAGINLPATVAVLGIVHYYWQVKSDLDFAEPLLYAFLLAVLLGVRLQHRLVHAKTAVPTPYQGVEPPQAGQKTSH